MGLAHPRNRRRSGCGARQNMRRSVAGTSSERRQNSRTLESAEDRSRGTSAAFWAVIAASCTRIGCAVPGVIARRPRRSSLRLSAPDSARGSTNYHFTTTSRVNCSDRDVPSKLPLESVALARIVRSVTPAGVAVEACVVLEPP